MEGFASLSVSVELGEFGFPEKFQKVGSRLCDPPLRNHAAGPVFRHVASLLPLGDNILPRPGCFVKLRDPSVNRLSVRVRWSRIAKPSGLSVLGSVLQWSKGPRHSGDNPLI